ncbi:hypothetical protein RF11_08204 [Thelohanellus kitauei]|uniref:Uncharacterized protein n=1 Tax=Thelohanellus kitauei TaxID=669202 RepID=A0A0C2JWK2_THEKT|nr:hypothetical protein RF11_08204 [Thelohanellus kitauei]
MNPETNDSEALSNDVRGENRQAIYSYINKAKSGDMSLQMEAVTEFISRFSSQDYPDADRIFIKNFPMQLYEEFQGMCESDRYDDRFQMKLILIVDVFKFIYRSSNLLKDCKAHLFLVIFLKFIKNITTNHSFSLDPILKSIKICTMYEPNKIFFIHENAMFYFHYFFKMQSLVDKREFWEICENIYMWNPEKISSWSRIKLTESIYRIMRKTSETRNVEYAKILFIILKMITHLRLLDDIEFYVNELIKITTSVLSRYRSFNYDQLFLLHASKIWSGIINGPRNTFLIDTLDKLNCLGAVFAIDLSCKLRNVLKGLGPFQVTKNIKQKLYIIYITLAPITKVDDLSSLSFQSAFKGLHILFRMYFEKCSFDHTIENQFILLQYFIKSHVSLKIPIEPDNEHVFYQLHTSFLASQLLYTRIIKSTVDESNHPDYLDMIKSLSDDNYINKLRREQQIVLYEDVKNGQLSKLNNICINQVFSKCLVSLMDASSRPKFADNRNSEYKIYRHLLARVVVSFYDSNYLDQMTADYFMRLCEDNSRISSQSLVYSDKFANDFTYKAATHTIFLKKVTFPTLLRWFMLMFEMKFIFDDVYSKFPNLYFL